MTKILIDEATVRLVLGKIKAARDCHPNAVDTLLFEAEEILETELADQPAQQEPVTWVNYEPDGMHHNKPAQRTWVGLTDEEFEDIELRCRSTPFGKIEAMQKVEAKLKEKNA